MYTGNLKGNHAEVEMYPFEQEVEGSMSGVRVASLFLKVLTTTDEIVISV